ncbi:MAG: NAD(P) transhydrogenase alpha subunit, partial [uncultured Pseudonocardia sp.]
AGRGAVLPAHRPLPRRPAGAPDGVRAGDRDRLLRHRARAPRPAHAADVGHQRHLRDHRGRRAAADRARRPGRDHRRRHRRPAGQHQRVRRVRRDPPHARHVHEGL